MSFVVVGEMLDACVLGALLAAPAYGYELTQKTQSKLGISESALYPVLRRLLKEGFLTSFDEPYDGRNRRYYELTEKGYRALFTYEAEWKRHKENIGYFLNEPDRAAPDEPDNQPPEAAGLQRSPPGAGAGSSQDGASGADGLHDSPSGAAGLQRSPPGAGAGSSQDGASGPGSLQDGASGAGAAQDSSSATGAAQDSASGPGKQDGQLKISGSQDRLLVPDGQKGETQGE